MRYLLSLLALTSGLLRRVATAGDDALYDFEDED